MRSRPASWWRSAPICRVHSPSNSTPGNSGSVFPSASGHGFRPKARTFTWFPARGVLLRCRPGTSCQSKRRVILSLNRTHRRRCRRRLIHHGRTTIPCPRLPFLSPISRHPAHPHAQSQIRRGKGASSIQPREECSSILDAYVISKGWGGYGAPLHISLLA